MAEIILFHPIGGVSDKITEKHVLPLSLLSIAAPLVKEGYKVKIIDQRTEPEWRSILSKHLKGKPLCIGITSMSGKQIINGLEASRMAKENDVTTVWGGVHPSLLPMQTIRNGLVDIVVKGEGEIAFLEIVKALNSGKSLKDVRGIIYKDDGRIKANKESPFLGLDSLEDVPYHLVDMERYIDVHYSRRTIGVLTSKGCPYRCGFCYNLNFNKRIWRAMSPESAFEKIKRVVDDYGIEDIGFFDDNFFVNIKRSQEIISLMRKEYPDIAWNCSGARIDTLEKMDLKWFAQNGCNELGIGIESGSERILKLVKKDITVKQIIGVNHKMKKHDIIPVYFVVGGFPTETQEELNKTMLLVLKIIRDNPNACLSALKVYTPFPGTDLYDLSIRHGFKPPSCLEGWGDFNFNIVNIPWLDKGRKNTMKLLYMLTVIIGKGVERYSMRPIFRLIAKLYYPLAIKRIERGFYGFPLEVMIAEKLNML